MNMGDRLRMEAILDAIQTERIRQQEEEHFTAEHDDTHEGGTLCAAAASYAVNARDCLQPLFIKESMHAAPVMWPWDQEWWKPTTPRRDLIKAAALIVAEIERIDRGK